MGHPLFLLDAKGVENRKCENLTTEETKDTKEPFHLLICSFPHLLI